VSTRFFFLFFKSTTVPFIEIKSTTVDRNLQCKHLRRFRIEDAHHHDHRHTTSPHTLSPQLSRLLSPAKAGAACLPLLHSKFPIPVFRMQQAAAAAVLVALLCAFYFNQPWAPDRPSDGVEAEFKEVSSDFQFTFNVDPVEVSSDPITSRNMSDPVDICHSSWTSPHSNLEACYVSSALPATRCISLAPDGESDFDHGLISAFFVSFAQHKRLVLRPDDIFFPLVDAAATHVFKQGIYRTSTSQQPTVVIIRNVFKHCVLQEKMPATSS
jgi:hypothetical protein